MEVRLKKWLGLAVVAVTSFAATGTANAVLITYDWIGQVSPTSGWSATGQVVIDDSSLILPSNTLDANTDFVSWFFQWTDGAAVTYSVDQSTGSFGPSLSSFTVDAAGLVTDFDLCASTTLLSTCSLTNHPLIYITPQWWDASDAFGSTIPDVSVVNGSAFGAGVPSVSVPLPGTLTLLGAGILALGLRRRKIQSTKLSK